MNLDKRIIYLLFMFSLATFSQKREQEKDSIKSETLQEIVITATRTLRQLSSVPLAVTLISKKQLSNVGSTRLKNILEEQTGIIFVTDASGFTGVQLQGIDADYTLILVDGVPLIGRSSGALNLERLTVNNIQQIEIVKGASSSLYGSEAIGGVINIITERLKSNVNKGNVSYFVRGGKRDELDLNTNYLFKKNKLGMITSLNLNSSGTYDVSPNTAGETSEAQKNFTGNLKITYDLNEKLDLLVNNRFYQQNQDSDSETNTLKEFNFNTKLSHTISDKLHVDYTFYTTKYKTESIFNEENSIYNQTLFKPEIRGDYQLKNGEIIAGVGMNFDALDRTFFEKEETFKTQYAFAQYDFHPTEKLNVIVGARFDHHNKYKSAFSPKVSARYKINNWLALKSSVGVGFKAPDFRQLFFNFNNSAAGYVVYGVRTMYDLFGDNAQVQQQVARDLNPESSIGYNVGFQLKPSSDLKININLFRNDIKDLINTAVFNGDLPGINSNTSVFYYENRNKVYTQGIEVNTNYRFSDNFRIIGGYQYLEAKDKEQENLLKSGGVYFRKTTTSPSEQLQISDYFGLANRSKHTANLKLLYQNIKHNLNANIRAVYRSKYALYDTNNSQEIIDTYDAFVKGNIVVNAAISKKLFHFMDFQFGVDNLFNSDGLENQNLFPNNDAVLRVGRTYYGRIQVNF